MGNVGGRPFQSSPGGGSGGNISRKELDRVQRRFSRLSHGTDRVSIQQLGAVPELCGNPFIQRLFELHDADGNGVLLHEEFLAALRAVRKLPASPQDRLQLAFNAYDLDGDGFVSADEMQKVLARTSAQGVPQEQLAAEVRHTMVAHDADGDGRLCFEEFRSLVLASVAPTRSVLAGQHDG